MHFSFARSMVGISHFFTHSFSSELACFLILVKSSEFFNEIDQKMSVESLETPTVAEEDLESQYFEPSHHASDKTLQRCRTLNGELIETHG